MHCRSSALCNIIMAEDGPPSNQVPIPKKRGRKTKSCLDCRLSKRICTHRALREDVDRENLALMPAQRTRLNTGVLLPRASSSTTSSSPTTPPLAVLNNNGNRLPRQEEGRTMTEPNATVAPTSSSLGERMVTRKRRKALLLKVRHRTAVNRLSILKRWNRRKACDEDDDAGKDIWEKVDGVLATAKEGHVVELASAKKHYDEKLLQIHGNLEAALDDKDKTIRRLEADIRRLKADLNNIQRGCLADEKVEQLERNLVETVSNHTSEVRDFRRQISEMQKCHELKMKVLCADKDKEIDRLKTKIGNITRGAIVDEKVEELERRLADQSTEHAGDIRGYRRRIAELQSKHIEEIGRMLAGRDERTKILNQTCDDLRESLETSRIEVSRLQVLEKEHNWQKRLLVLNLGKRASECVPEYDASGMKWTSDEGEKACQTPKVTTKSKARRIVAVLYKEAQGNKEYAIELLRAMTRNVVAADLFSELGWKGQGPDPVEAQKQV